VSRLTRRYSLREVEECLRGELEGHPEAPELNARTQAALRWLRERGAEERLFIVDQALNVQELARLTREVAAGGPLGGVLVDYIQQVRPGRRFETRQREVGYVSRTLQGLAQETGVPILCAAQLNRVSEGLSRTDRPRLWQLREAGDLEQDATTVYGLYNHQQAKQEENGGDDAPRSASVSGGSASNSGWGPRSTGGRSATGGGRQKRTTVGRASGGDSAPRLDVESTAASSTRPGGRWVAPQALRAVALDVEVLKAKHGRTHVRVALTYDMIANFITDGVTDGAGEAENATDGRA